MRSAVTCKTQIDFHVESRTQYLVSRGMDPKAARSAALQEFGDVREARAELEKIGRRRVRHVRRSDWWSDLRQDVRYGVRSLVHAPLFSVLATATLALGIGANAAIFSVVKSVLIDALPYADAGRLVRVYGRLLDGLMERAALSAGSVEEIQQAAALVRANGHIRRPRRQRVCSEVTTTRESRKSSGSGQASSRRSGFPLRGVERFAATKARAAWCR